MRLRLCKYLTAVGDADVAPPTSPLAVPDRDALVGKYTYGTGPRDHFTIEVRTEMLKREQLTLERAGAPSRQNLYHVGNLVFSRPASQAQKSPSPGKARRSHS